MFVLPIILPIFALIFAGWFARRIGALGDQAASELNRFVVYLALPVLLFDIVAHASWSEMWNPAFIAVFGLGAASVFIVVVMASYCSTRSLLDGAIDGLNAAYANTGFVGFPLVLAVLGRSALVPTLIATILTVCVLFAIALILVEIATQPKSRAGPLSAKVSWALVRNPLLVAPALGAVFLGFNIAIPQPMDSFLKLLGGATAPCALIALGLFLAEKRPGERPAKGAVGALVVAKLVGQPMITWLLATQVFRLSPPLTHIAVLLAALPTGTGPFMLAELHRRRPGITASVILITTIVSLATITLYLNLVEVPGGYPGTGPTG